MLFSAGIGSVPVHRGMVMDVQHPFHTPDTVQVSFPVMDLRSLRYFVAVAEERHIGRAALRLHMTQPPLSRAIKALEAELGAVLLYRSSTGVSLTPAGSVLYGEARTLLEQAAQARARVSAATGTATINIGILADSAEQVGAHLAAAFRRRHPDVDIRIREADLTDPTTGLRAGLVDVALTRAPFDTTGISTHVLRSDPVGVVVRTDDPLARHDTLQLRELSDRRWFQLPAGTDATWRAYWNGADRNDTDDNRDDIGSGEVREGPVIRTVHECLQTVLWNDTIGLTPLDHALPDGLTAVPLSDMPRAASSSPGTPPTPTHSSARSHSSPQPPTGRAVKSGVDMGGRAKRPASALNGATVDHPHESVPAGQLAIAVRRPSKTTPFADGGFEAPRGDSGDPSSLPAAFADADQLLLVSSNDPTADTLTLQGTAIDAGVGVGVGVGGSAVPATRARRLTPRSELGVTTPRPSSCSPRPASRGHRCATAPTLTASAGR